MADQPAGGRTPVELSLEEMEVMPLLSNRSTSAANLPKSVETLA